MNRRDQLEAWDKTRNILKQLVENDSSNPWRKEFEEILRLAEINNPWFTKNQIELSVNGIIKLLEPVGLQTWINKYPENTNPPKNVGVIMAGNIPMAGFHDFLCVLLSGNTLVAKLSGSDKFLIPFIAKILFSFLPELSSKFHLSEQLKEVDAVIATGSNNTSRYFEYYFGKKPHIFRKNRNSAGILNGEENEFDYLLLGRDIFSYFGLGCRNVSKLYVPTGYNFNEFFNNIIQYNEVMQHSKYMNNFDYHQAIFLMNRRPFLTNNFLIVTEDQALASPVGVVYYEYYTSDENLKRSLEERKDELQCVVSKSGPIQFGQAQFPEISDYADGVDTMQFLVSL